MKHSEQINELATALAKAQGQIEGAKKTSDNLYFKSKYADLAEVWEACRKPLADNGLAVVQGDGIASEDGNVSIETMLLHVSGQWISSSLEAKPTKTDPQGIGSCITYLRRYGLQSLVGISPEDDDGNAASQADQKSKPQKPQPQKPALDKTKEVTDQAFFEYCTVNAEFLADYDGKVEFDRQKFEAEIIKEFKGLPTKNESIQKIIETIKPENCI